MPWRGNEGKASVSVKPDEQRPTDRAARGEPSLLELSRVVTEEGEAKLAWAMPWRGNEGKASVSVKPDEQRLSLLRLCHGEGTKANPTYIKHQYNGKCRQHKIADA